MKGISTSTGLMRNMASSFSHRLFHLFCCLAFQIPIRIPLLGTSAEADSSLWEASDAWISLLLIFFSLVEKTSLRTSIFLRYYWLILVIVWISHLTLSNFHASPWRDYGNNCILESGTLFVQYSEILEISFLAVLAFFFSFLE